MPLKWLAREARYRWQVLTYRLPEQSPLSRPTAAAPKASLIGRWYCVVRAYTPAGAVVVARDYFEWLAADASEVQAELEYRAQQVDPRWQYECTATPAVKP